MATFWSFTYIVFDFSGFIPTVLWFTFVWYWFENLKGGRIFDVELSFMHHQSFFEMMEEKFCSEDCFFLAKNIFAMNFYRESDKPIHNSCSIRFNCFSRWPVSRDGRRWSLTAIFSPCLCEKLIVKGTGHRRQMKKPQDNLVNLLGKQKQKLLCPNWIDSQLFLWQAGNM